MKLKFLGILALLIGVDQGIKYWADTVLSTVNGIALIPNVVELYYLENRGAAFGVLQGNTFFLVIVTFFLLLGLVYLLFSGKIKNKIMFYSMTLIVAGGVGNLIDRVVKGYVTDYIRCLFIDFPVFNFADSLVVIGAGLLMIYILFFEEKQTK